ncbi:LPXTG cell wall anchor domain-containing protein [Stagnihabitans tardus]|uniref:LPXTG cell wall anchor domain-containing protein n=1 Tax=Stagnihabitans tardus TaxID=2699202 RepID=A0AAE4Y8B2_9RHOB|nr:LPXTG cell wall anchor domain-containing protein [Stagnihabitans tardus]NBZ87017.1 LPXTG cell wall anchor domain-containing protein [Stagnihabitans tardus]
MMRFLTSALLSAAFTLGVAPASAATYDFSYTSGNGITMTATLEGSALADGNRIQVNSVTSLVIGGITRTVLKAYKFYDDLSFSAGWLSLDGQDNALVIRVVSVPYPDELMFFTAGEGQLWEYDRFYGSGLFSEQGEQVITANYSLTEAAPPAPTPAPVPLPAGGLLLLSGLGFLVLRRKRG